MDPMGIVLIFGCIAVGVIIIIIVSLQDSAKDKPSSSSTVSKLDPEKPATGPTDYQLSIKRFEKKSTIFTPLSH